MLKILELCFSPDYGGLEIHMRDFSLWLAKKSDCKLIIAVSEGSRLQYSLKSSDVLIKSLPKKQNNLLSKSRILANYIDENLIDVVHVHWKYDLFTVALAKKFSKRKFKFVHTRQMSLPGKKYDPYHRFIYNSIDCFIAITKLISKQAEMNLPIPREKIKQIYYGVKLPPEINKADIVKLKKQFAISGEFVVGLVGRISEFKGQHLLLESVNNLKVKGVFINVVIVGEPFDLKYFNKLKNFVDENNLSEQVKFLDFHPNPYELMNCFDTLVLTTKRETFGLVLIEAMHCGIPVIGSNAGGVPEIIDGGITGLLFESGNAESLSDEIIKLYNDKKFRQNIASNGREKAIKKFNAELQYEKVFQVLNEL